MQAPTARLTSSIRRMRRVASSCLRRNWLRWMPTKWAREEAHMHSTMSTTWLSRIFQMLLARQTSPVKVGSNAWWPLHQRTWSGSLTQPKTRSTDCTKARQLCSAKLKMLTLMTTMRKVRRARKACKGLARETKTDRQTRRKSRIYRALIRRIRCSNLALIAKTQSFQVWVATRPRKQTMLGWRLPSSLNLSGTARSGNEGASTSRMTSSPAKSSSNKCSIRSRPARGATTPTAQIRSNCSSRYRLRMRSMTPGMWRRRRWLTPQMSSRIKLGGLIRVISWIFRRTSQSSARGQAPFAFITPQKIRTQSLKWVRIS